jgi:hypothetical protein
MFRHLNKDDLPSKSEQLKTDINKALGAKFDVNLGRVAETISYPSPTG